MIRTKHWPNLAKVVSESENWLRWLTPDIANLHESIERFHATHAADPDAIPAFDVHGFDPTVPLV